MTEAVLGTLGVVIGAVLTYLGIRFSARQSAKAAASSSAVSSRQVDVEEWRTIVAELRAEIKRLNERVDEVVEDRAAERSRFQTLMSYTRELLVWARRTAPDEIPPSPPSIFVDDLLYFIER